MHAPAPAVAAAAALAALSLTGCQGGDAAASSQPMSTPIMATVNQLSGAVPPLSEDVPTAGLEWTGGSDGTGMFSVGSKAGDGIPAVIPPGRYQVKLAPGAQEGSWMLCDSAECGPAFPENATVIGRPIGPSSSAMYIGARSRTLWLDNVILSPSRD